MSQQTRNADPMLAHRLRRHATLGQRIVTYRVRWGVVLTRSHTSHPIWPLRRRIANYPSYEAYLFDV